MAIKSSDKSENWPYWFNNSLIVTESRFEWHWWPLLIPSYQLATFFSNILRKFTQTQSTHVVNSSNFFSFLTSLTVAANQKQYALIISISYCFEYSTFIELLVRCTFNFNYLILAWHTQTHGMVVFNWHQPLLSYTPEFIFWNNYETVSGQFLNEN